MQAKAWRYLRTLAGASIVLFLACVAVAVIADPYYVFDTPLITGVNFFKPRAERREVVAKEALLARACARTILLGNSRFETGIDPTSAAWPADSRPVFNAGVPGTGPWTAVALLRRAGEKCPPWLIVAEVDFPDFLVAANEADPPPEPPDDALHWLQTRLQVTLTLGALIDSAATLAAQHLPDPATLTEQGFNPQADYRVATARQGPGVLFAAKEAAYRQALLAAPQPSFDPHDNTALRGLVALLQIARAGGIRLVLVVPPYHVSYDALLHSTGRWPAFLAWKQSIVAEVRRATTPSWRPELIDFAVANEQTGEPVPLGADRLKPMRFYWELGHFRPAMGDLMIERIFGTGGFGDNLLASD